MKMFNATALPAKLLASPDVPGEYGHGAVIAKATFRFDVRGKVELETETPVPLFDRDVETPLGVMPADILGRRGERFEVMLLGCAHAPSRGSSTRLRAALQVGEERRELEVFGDRVWEAAPDGQQRVGAPRPFQSMPLVYERAFGGSFPACIDEHSVLDVFDPINRRGMGFDAEMWAAALGQSLGAPPGYPTLPGYQRSLPNIEDPTRLIRAPGDAPEPAGWAAVYADTAIGLLPVVRKESARVERARAAGEADAQRLRDEAVERADPDADPDQGLYRAHPDWIIDTPPARARILLENVTPDAARVELTLPELRVIADYVIYDRQGSRELRPHALVLLPEHGVFYLVYRLAFTFEKGPANDRALRLRTQAGWFQAEGH